MPAFTRKGVTRVENVKELNQYSPIVAKYAVTADTTTAAVAFIAPCAMQLLDFSVLAQATNGGGTLTPRKGDTDAICTAIACATDGAVARMAAGAVVANVARTVLAKGDKVYVIANGAADRGILTITGIRI